MARRRVLLLTQSHCPVGGMESWLCKFAAWLGCRGWEVTVGLARGARFNLPGPYLEAHPGLPAVEMDGRAGTESARREAIRRTIVAGRPDVVVSIALGAIFAVVRDLKAEEAGFRFVLPVRSLHPDLLVNVVENQDVVDAVVGVSRLLETYLRRNVESSGPIVRYVRHGVREAFAPRMPRARELRIGYVGRLDPGSKRILDLVPFARALVSARVAIRLEVFGDGEAREVLGRELRSAAPGLPVRFHGSVSNEALYEQAYPALDVTMLFSPAEGSPTASYEAMKNGVVPVVSRFEGAAAEGLFRDGENALTFDVGDVESAAAAARQLSDDRGLLERLSAAAASSVAEWNEERMHGDWERILLEALERPPVRPARRAERVGPSGRLERLGVPGPLANRLRLFLGRRVLHADGFDEWPGTAPASRARVQETVEELHEIEQAAREGRSDGIAGRVASRG